MDIPLCTALSESPSYQILFNNGMSASIPLPEMQSMIPAPPVPMTNPAESLPAHSSLLLPFLSVNSRITYKHEGTYHKGFSLANLVGHTASVLRPMSRRNPRIGVSIFPTYLSIGWIFVLTVF